MPRQMQRVTGMVTRAGPVDCGDPLGGGAAEATCFAHPAADPPTVSSLFAAVKANAPRHAVLAQLDLLGCEACRAVDDGGHTISHWARGLPCPKNTASGESGSREKRGNSKDVCGFQAVVQGQARRRSSAGSRPQPWRAGIRAIGRRRWHGAAPLGVHRGQR